LDKLAKLDDAYNTRKFYPEIEDISEKPYEFTERVEYVEKLTEDFLTKTEEVLNNLVTLPDTCTDIKNMLYLPAFYACTRSRHAKRIRIFHAAVKTFEDMFRNFEAHFINTLIFYVVDLEIINKAIKPFY